ncbi:Gfo/Idh/MocA family protein [Gracilibacillus marinus]|uniref:Gfo/Idh/MocA family protein n=1 Tax=Gracilibacillus marinus TaxID=630535 RepID=A0ABV8W150_9BACI
MVKLKIGVLSTAKIGREQVIPAIQRSQNAEVVAIASRNIENAKKVAEELSIPNTYSSYLDLLNDQSIDAVYIPLPNAMHKEWVMKACEHKKHVLCEKPITLDAAELEEIKKVAEENNVYVMEAFMYQFHPQHQKVKELLNSGAIGNVTMMRASFSFYLDDRTNIRLNNELGGGSMYDVGCYSIHAIRNILNQEPITVYAKSVERDNLGVDTTMTGVLSFENGIVGLFDSSFDSTHRQEYEVIGSKGTIRVSAAFRPDTSKDGKGKVILCVDGKEPEEFSIDGDQYTLMVEDFADAITKNRALSYTIDMALNQMKIVEAVYRSSESNNVVIVD